MAGTIKGGILSSTALVAGKMLKCDTNGQVTNATNTDTDVADAIAKKHTQGSDTTLGNMTADVNMNSHKFTGLSVPASNGDSIRATAKITEALLESATDLKHTQNTDNALSALDGTPNNAVYVDNDGNVGIGTTNPSAKLDIEAGNLGLDNTTNSNRYGVITKGGGRFIHDFNYGNNGTVTTEGGNIFIGSEAGNLTMGSGATATRHASRNSAIGYASLYANTEGYQNSAIGYASLYANTTGYRNSAIGNLSGHYITGGSDPNQTSDNSLYLGYDTRAYADGDTNEIVIGANTTGLGSNTVVLGNSSITTTALRGNVGIGTTTPDRRVHVEISDATTNAVTYTGRDTHITSGTPAANIGVGREFEVETAADNNEIIATYEALATDVSSGVEEGAFVIKVMQAGAAATEVFRAAGDKITLIPAELAIAYASIKATNVSSAKNYELPDISGTIAVSEMTCANGFEIITYS